MAAARATPHWHARDRMRRSRRPLSADRRSSRVAIANLLPPIWKEGGLQAAEKSSRAVILRPFAVILSAAKNLALSIFMAMRDSSSPAAPQNDSLGGFFRTLFRPALPAAPSKRS
jgi:hypothetical protein